MAGKMLPDAHAAGAGKLDFLNPERALAGGHQKGIRTGGEKSAGRGAAAGGIIETGHWWKNFDHRAVGQSGAGSRPGMEGADTAFKSGGRL